MAEPMTADEWQAHVMRQAALAIGRWLEARGRLERPINSLTRHDLECMAENAISRFIVLASRRRTSTPNSEERDALHRLLLGEPHARSAAGKPAASATATSGSRITTPTTASARWPA